MFTGLIETTGTVLSVEPCEGTMRIVVAAPQLTGRWNTGNSIAVNGVCLTALPVKEGNKEHPGRFAADLAAETVERTTLSFLGPGSLVNLELPTPLGAPLGGHVVQGHVDGTGKLIALVPLHPGTDTTDWRMTIKVPESIVPNVIPQGSLTVDGISLTVARMEDRRIEIAIIPHTYKSTNLRSLLAGSAVNLEADVLSKYAAQQRTATAKPFAPTAETEDATDFKLTIEYLLGNGY